MKRIVWIGLTASLWPLFALTQVTKRANRWYFGYRAGIDFSSAVPVPLTDGALSTWEGCASMCDEQGNLLLYADGSSVWNRQHTLIPNATNLGADSSATQAATILPMPGSTSLYYIFSVDFESRQGGVQYAVMDVNAGGGAGSVVSKNNRLTARTTEKLTVVKHCNNRDFWLITHGWDNNEFLAFLLTDQGISPTPVISRVGMVDTQNTVRGLGYLKASPDSRRLAQGLWRANTFEVFDFDNTTGAVSNPITLTDPGFSGAYGVEFSPSGRFLYAGAVFTGNIYQFDLQKGNDPVTLSASKTVIGKINTSESFKVGALQMAPNGKIYAAINKQAYLGVIENPETAGSGCGFNQNAVPLSGRMSGLGLPNIPAFVFKIKSEVSLTLQKSASKDCNDRRLKAETNAQKPLFQWYLNKQLLSAGSDSSFKPTVGGVYSVRVIEGVSCVPDTCQSEPVEVEMLKTDLTADVLTCAKSQINAKTNGFIKWTGPSVTDKNRFQQDSLIVSGTASAVYSALTYPNRSDSSCYVENTITVPFSNVGKFIYSPVPTPSCEDSIMLKVNEPDYDRVTWIGPGNVTAIAPSLTVTQSGEYTVLVANSTNGCQAQDKIKVQFLDKPLSPTIGGNKTVCANEKSIELKAVGTGIRWYADAELRQSIGAGNDLSLPLAGAALGDLTFYAIQVSVNSCLSKPAAFVLKVNAAPVTDVTQSMISHCFVSQPEQVLKVTPTEGRQYTWFEVENPTPLGNSAEIAIQKEGVYIVKTTNPENCSATDTITVVTKCRPVLFVPDSFSPNEDGINDVLPLYGESLTDFEWLIFDRWGNTVYRLQSHNLVDAARQFWNGTHSNGKPALSGVYPWKITMKDDTYPGGVYVSTGSVVLLR